MNLVLQLSGSQQGGTGTTLWGTTDLVNVVMLPSQIEAWGLALGTAHLRSETRKGGHQGVCREQAMPLGSMQGVRAPGPPEPSEGSGSAWAPQPAK